MKTFTLHRLFLPLLGVACLVLALPTARAQTGDDADDDTPVARGAKAKPKLVQTSLRQPNPPELYVIRNGQELNTPWAGARRSSSDPKILPGETIIIKAPLTWFDRKGHAGKWLPLPGKPLTLVINGQEIPTPAPTGADGIVRWEYVVPANTPVNTVKKLIATKLPVQIAFAGDAQYKKCPPIKIGVPVFAP